MERQARILDNGLCLGYYLSAGVRKTPVLWPLLQETVKDVVELLLVVSVSHNAGESGVAV